MGYRRNCNLCKSSSLYIVYDLGESPVGDAFKIDRKNAIYLKKYPLALLLCSNCGHLQITYTVDADELYTQDYLYESTISLNLDFHFENFAQDICQLPGISSGCFVVDIGSNVGLFLNYMKKNDMNVLGVEPSVKAAEKANIVGINTVCELFTSQVAYEIVQSHGHADIITASNTFANIEDTESFINGIDILLSPNGYFIIETGYALDLISNCIIDNIYHEHISYFFCSPLERFLRLHGFTICLIKRVATKGGSVRIFVKRESTLCKQDWSVTSLMLLEKELDCFSLESYARFKNTMDFQRDTLRKIIFSFPKEMPIVAFGASVGATTLLYWLGIGERINYIIDDNPIKHGLFSPGLGLKIYPAQEVKNNPPEVIINLAWRYIEPIMNKHVSYFLDKSRILQPLPVVKWIPSPVTAHRI